MSKRLIRNILLALFIFFPIISWGEIYHTVKGDETLWRIAKKYDTTVEKLQQVNGLNSNRICVGQRLCIQHNSPLIPSERETILTPDPSQEETALINSAIPDSSLKERETCLENSYIVKKGDTLFSIARRTGCTVEGIKEINRLINNTIEISQVLLLTAKTVNPDAKDIDSKSQTSREEKPPSAQVENHTRLAVKKTASLEEEQYIPFSEHPGDIGPQIVTTAKRYLYLPYKSGGEIGDESTDCSGFVKRTFGYFGIKLPRTAREQFNMGIPVIELAEGDLVFFTTYASYPSHVGIYIGNDKFIHSSSYRSGGVRIDSLESNYYHKRYIGARRVVAVE